MFHDLWGSYGYLILVKVNILMLIEWSYAPPPLPSKMMLTTDLVMVSIFWEHNPISFIHMFLWYQFLDPHLITYNLSIDVYTFVMFDLGTSTLFE